MKKSRNGIGTSTSKTGLNSLSNRKGNPGPKSKITKQPMRSSAGGINTSAGSRRGN